MKYSILSKFFWFCILMLICRVYMTGHLSFFFLIWNLFLAWLPYWIIKKCEQSRPILAQITLIGLCILFLPNAPYIITDLFHLTKNLKAPLWFDLVLILSFSSLGLIYFVLSCEKLFAIVQKFIPSKFWFRNFKLLVVLSNGYGIYLGRYLRFNSWDIITNPDELAKRIFISIFSPGHFKETFSVTLIFAVFLYLILELYESSKTSLKAFPHELPERS
jgi:uncharacterized membrane protein